MIPPDFDLAAAHRYFAAWCFNQAWDLIDKQDRTPDEDERMLLLNQASLWHWSQRPDCTAKNLSIGYWQASRIHAILRRTGEAARYAELCLSHTPADDPFLMGYAHEALARAAHLAGNRDAASKHLRAATEFCGQVGDADDRQLLERDLHSLASSKD